MGGANRVAEAREDAVGVGEGGQREPLKKKNATPENKFQNHFKNPEKRKMFPKSNNAKGYFFCISISPA